jgi:hypothetical protein
MGPRRTHQDQTGNLYVRNSPAATNSSARGSSSGREHQPAAAAVKGRLRASRPLAFLLCHPDDGPPAYEGCLSCQIAFAESMMAFRGARPAAELDA